MATKEKNNEEIVSVDLKAEKRIVDSKNCFVITPIGSKNEPIRRHIDGVYDAAIVPVLEEFGYTPEIPHRMSIPGSINKQIIKKIYDSDLIIANLTDINPNVMYELALRHCFNKPAIIIAEDGTELPFDINNERTIFYINDAQGILDLKKKLRKTINDFKEKEKYSSPVVSVLGELKFEEQLLEQKNGTQNDDFVNSLQLILRRLDGIERESRNNTKNYSISEIHSDKRTYRIFSPENYEHDFETILPRFIDRCKEFGARVRWRFIDDNICQLYLYQLNPQLADSLDSDLRDFCQHYKLSFERVL